MIRSGRHPHEVMFLASIAFAGVGGVVNRERSANAVLKDLSPTVLTVFYGVLALGTLLALVGVFTKGQKGPVLEWFGLGIFTLELLAYGIAVFDYAGWRGLIGAGFAVGMALGNVWRMTQVWSDIKRARAGKELLRRGGEE